MITGESGGNPGTDGIEGAKGDCSPLGSVYLSGLLLT